MVLKLKNPITAATCVLALALASGCAERGETDVRRTPVVAAVERAMPSVANIGTERMVRVFHDDPTQRARDMLREQLFADFFGRPPPSEYKPAHSLGSGVVIHPDGLILTNYHVVERASTVYVSVDVHQNVVARVLAGDPVSDLALLKIDVDEPLQPIIFAADDDLLLGEQVIVLGNPYGLSQTVTVGVLSSKEREARHDGQVIFRDILQTDAAVNPGSSGGAMLNVEGELIGINIAVYREAQNIGFAVPVKRVRQLLEHWLSTEFLLSKSVGIAVAEDRAAGIVQIVHVLEGSGAVDSGLRPGHRIVAVNGRSVDSLLCYRKLLLAAAFSGRDVRLKLETAAGVAQAATLGWTEIVRPSGSDLVEQHFGLALDAEEPGQDQSFSKGLMITDVVEGSVSARAGLYPGLYLLAVDGMPVQNQESLSEVMQSIGSGDRVRIIVAEFIEEGTMRIARQLSMNFVAD